MYCSDVEGVKVVYLVLIYMPNNLIMYRLYTRIVALKERACALKLCPGLNPIPKYLRPLKGGSHPFTKGSEVPPDLTAVRFLAPLTSSSTMPPLGRVKLLVFLLFRNPFFTEGRGKQTERNDEQSSIQLVRVQIYLFIKKYPWSHKKK